MQKRHTFVTVLAAGNSKIKAPGDAILVTALLLDCRRLPSHYVLMEQKERETWSGGRGVWGGRAEKIFEEVMPRNLKIFKLDGKE